jgi:hypothetical protein
MPNQFDAVSEAGAMSRQAGYESWGDATAKSAWDQYISEMRKQYDYFANWTPGYPLALGDVGVINHGIFRRITSLDRLGISFDVRDDPTPESQKYATAQGVSVAFKAAGRSPAAGSVLTEAEAGFTVEFSSKHATLYEAIGCTTPSIADLLALGEQVLRQYQAAHWNRAWAVIVDLAASTGGNCACTRADEEVLVEGVLVLGPSNPAAAIPGSASDLYAANVRARARQETHAQHFARTVG